jgi:hypothetical protein
VTTVYSALTGNVQAGDTVAATFTVSPTLPAGCTPLPYVLAAYRSPYATFQKAQNTQQVLFSQQNGTFAAGTTNTLTATVPPSPAPGSGQITIGPASMEGALESHPGDFVSAGYNFTIPGSHPDANVVFTNPQVSFAYRCVKGGPVLGSFVATMPTANYQVPAGSSDWFPTGDGQAPAGYQGFAVVPDVCSGGSVFMDYGGSFGATFTATVSSSVPLNSVHVRFHYRNPAAKGQGNINCSDPTQNTPPNGVNACGASMSSTNEVVPSAFQHFQIDFAQSVLLNPPHYGPLVITAAYG